MDDYVRTLLKYHEDLSIDPSDLKKQTSASPLLVGGPKEIDIHPLDLRKVEQMLILHPVIPRGIEIKANRMVSRGYEIEGSNQEAVEYCKKILEESGGIIFLKRWIEDTIAFGNGYAELVPNKAGTEILKLDIQHPVYFGFYKEKVGTKWKIVLDPRTQKPIAYSQYKVENDELVPFGKKIPTDRIAHLIFDTWGDEMEGISIVQYLRYVLTNIINTENAAAQSAYLTGNPRYKFTTNLRDFKKIQEFGRMVKNINERDAVILGEGADAEILNPGQTNFPDYHERFLMLLASKLGIPLPLLTMDATSTNKACYSADTEVLTDKGWKYYWEVKKNDKIVQYDPKTNELKTVKHDGKTYVYDIDEEMYRFVNKRADIMVTDNHRMLYAEHRSDKWRVDQAKDIKLRNIKFKVSGDWKGLKKDYVIIKPTPTKDKRYTKPIKMDIDDYLEFIGYYLSEGGFSSEPLKKGGRKIYNITFSQHLSNDKQLFDFFRKLERKYGIYIGNYIDDKNRHYNLCNKQIWTHLLKEDYGRYCNEKRIPNWIKQLPKEKLKILLKALIYGDGSKNSNGFVFYTTSKQLADDVQEIAFKCGYMATLHLHYKKGIFGKRKKNFDAWRVFISPQQEIQLDTKKQIEKIHYKGKVFCFRVGSGFFVTRRNGKIAIQGNTLSSQLAFLRDENKADEEVVAQAINKQIFEVACKLKFGEHFKDFPKFKWKEFLVDESEFVNTQKIKSETILNLLDAYEKAPSDEIKQNIMQTLLKFTGRENEVQ